MNIKKIIEEEVEKQSKKFSVDSDDLKFFMTELFSFNSSKLLTSLGNQDEILDSKDLLPEEFWQSLIDIINESYSDLSEEWETSFKEIKLQILCNKYFTKKELVSLNELEKSLRLDIKKYFSSLQNYTDTENFKERFFNLPNHILINFTRYILNKSAALNKKISLKKQDVKEEILKLKTERKKFIDKISFLSNKNVSSLDLTEAKKLIDNGLFYEDNLLNRGVCEYLYKLVNHSTASEKIIETFNSTFLNDLKQSLEESNSYLSHISSIKNEETAEYFSTTGIQIGRRFDNEIDAIKNPDKDSIIDEDSIFKEPKGRIKSTFNWDGNEPSDGESETGADADGDMGGGSDLGGGGGFSGGGGTDSFSGPTGGEETVDLDMPDGTTAPEGEEGMPPGKDGLPVDFGTPESNAPDVETETPDETDKK
ncbi:MAG: hypothetical protein ABIP51_20630 [Bacteroidia bacterium]